MSEDTWRKVGVIVLVLIILGLMIYAMQNVKAQELSADIDINIDVEGNVTGSAEISIETDESTQFSNRLVCEWTNSTINRTINIIYILPTANISVKVETVINSTVVIAYIEINIQDAIQHGINITIHPHKWDQKVTGPEADFWGSHEADIIASRNLTMWAEKHNDSISITFNSTDSSPATVTITKEALINIAILLDCEVSELDIQHTTGINRTVMNDDGSMTVYIDHFSNQTLTFTNETESTGIASWLLTESYGGAPVWAWLLVTFLLIVIAAEAYRRR